MPVPADIIQSFVTFFHSGWFLVIQLIGGMASLVLLVTIVWLIKGAGYPQRHLRHLWISWNAGPVPKHKTEKKWKAIETALKRDDPELWRSAILKCDIMLDQILAAIGYEGGNVDERLTNANPEQFQSLNEAWRAHKIRQFIEEDPNYLPTRKVAEKTIEIYRNIFVETGII